MNYDLVLIRLLDFRDVGQPLAYYARSRRLANPPVLVAHLHLALAAIGRRDGDEKIGQVPPLWNFTSLVEFWLRGRGNE